MASLYDPLHPAVLRLVANTINAGERAGKPVAVCGEMAGDSRMTRLLLGLGLTEFSMHPQQLLDVKREVRRAHSNALRIKVASALNRALPVDLDAPGQADPASEAPAAPLARAFHEKPGTARFRALFCATPGARRAGRISCGTPIRRGW